MGNVALVKKLLEAGGDPHPHCHVSPLFGALTCVRVSVNAIRTLRLLLEAGARVDVDKSRREFTAEVPIAVVNVNESRVH